MEPLKWQKYLLLVGFGLTNIEELHRQINRVRWESRWQLFDELSDRLPDGADATTEFTVIKLVTMHNVGQLENIQLMTRSNLAKLRRAFNERRSDIAEVWACRTRVGSNVSSVAGRLAVSTTLEPFGQCVEQVWQCSPRMLEKVGDGFKFPYVRAHRDSWGRAYVIDDVYLPRGWRRRNELIRREFSDSVRALERSRERMEELGDLIEGIGITSYSFEYKVISGHVTIIDWDTSDDREVLRNAASRGLLSVLQ